MIYRLGVDVQRPDGGKLGELHRVVFDPETGEVVSLVVTHNALDGREVVVPVGTVQSADDDALTLAASEEQFDMFDDFDVQRNLAPPPDAANVTSDLVDDPVDVPDVPPIGAATGVESIAYTPIIQEDINVPTGDQVLDGTTTVWATDREIGHVKEVRASDETSRVTSLVVERGVFFKHDTEVPFDALETVTSDTIVLSVESAALENGDNV